MAAKHSDKRGEVLRFVEKFALVLNDAGLPRMEARVFSYALADDADHYTAEELANGLGVSRAAISSATRSLVSGGLLGREREPGARVDTYRVFDGDIWMMINQQRNPLLKRFIDVLAEGIEALGTETEGGKRLLETRAYLKFMNDRLPALVEEWHGLRENLMEEQAREFD